MIDRAMIQRTIESALAARRSGDVAAIASHFAADATFRMVGRSDMLGFGVGPVDAMAAIGGLVGLFDFHRMDLLHVAIDGCVAVIHWEVEASSGDGPHLVTELCDIWTFDDDAKIMSVVEFGDTGLIAHMAAIGR